MPRSIPVGRTTRMSFYSPGGETPHVMPDGSWLEPEAFAYPGDTFSRRAYVNMPDGSRRVVRCCCADTYSSIPARVRIAGRTVKGFVSCGKGAGYTFTPYDNQDGCR